MDYSKQRFEQLFKDNYGPMYRMAFAVTEDEEEARDAVSHVFARLWHTQPTIGQESVRGYLLAAVRNQSLHQLRKRRLQQKMESELRRPALDDPWPDRQELLEELQRVIDESLTEQDRRILSLHYDEALSYAETATRLGISIAAVNKHITRSLARLRCHFKKR